MCWYVENKKVLTVRQIHDPLSRVVKHRLHANADDFDVTLQIVGQDFARELLAVSKLRKNKRD